MKFLYLSLLFSFCASAQYYDETLFVWVQDQQNPFKGQCFEIDKETYGKTYSTRVASVKCKPQKVVHYWVPEPERYSGKCYLVDEETQGKKYSGYASPDKCVPPTATPQWIVDNEGKSHCFLVDQERGFVLKSSKDKCKTKKISTIWIPNSNRFGGKCFEVDEETRGEQYKRRVSNPKCRPDEVRYQWEQDYKNFSGQCYEIAISGPATYSNLTERSKCISSDFTYQWNKEAAVCLKVGKTVNNSQYLLKVQSNNCSPEETTKIFVKTGKFSGECYEVDKLTKGNVYRTKVPTKRCTPENTMDVLMKTSSRQSCFRIDTETRGENFIQRIRDDFCAKDGAPPSWFPDESGWDGQCKKVMIVVGNPMQKTLSDQSCEPSKDKLTYAWHNTARLKGKCYQIHVNGPSLYSTPVESKKCRPKNISLIFDIPKDGKGRCYEVDSETKGEKYHRPVLNKLCKEKVLWKPAKY